jgi:hypothetical protein
MSHGQQRKYNRRVAAAKRAVEEKHGNFNVYEKPTQIKRIFSIFVPQKEINHNVKVITLKPVYLV